MTRLSFVFFLGVALFAAVDDSGECFAQERRVFDENAGEWVAGAKIDGPGEGPLGQARQLVAEKKFRPAEKQLKKYIKSLRDRPDSPELRAAVLLYADCAFMRGRYYKAHNRYQRLINDYPQTEEYAWSLRHDLDIARAWLAGRKRRLWGVFRVSAVDEALDILSQIEQLAPGDTIAEVASRARADHYFAVGEFDLAQISYRSLIERHKLAGNRSTPAALARLKQAILRRAQSLLAVFAGVAFDDTPLLESREVYSGYLIRFGQDVKSQDVASLLVDIENKRAQKEYRVGRFYVRVRKPQAATFYFNYVQSTWPDTLWAERARADMAELGAGMAVDQGK